MPTDRVSRALSQHGYVQIKKVGSGSFGQAILVQRVGELAKQDQGQYICKMIDISRCTAKEKADALREGQLLKTLKHPYIVRYRESFIEDGWLCIVMDYCEGGDLHQKIKEAKARNRPIDEEQVKRWLTQAALALKYIHEKHILHRDLKSSNFFLSKNGNLKLGDFGIAKVLESTAACAQTQIGTPYYLSPEICAEKPYAWPSDIWAMGCILFEMCTLRVPFDASDLKGLVQKITRGPTPSIPASSRYSAPLRELASEMLNRDMSKRPGAEMLLKRPLVQDQVRKLLGEAQGAEEQQQQQQQQSCLAADVLPDGAASEPKDAASNPPAEVPTPARHAAGPYAAKYKRGDVVEYYSATHKEWLPAIVNSVDEEGRIILNVKPNTKLSLQLQEERVRPRQQQPQQQRQPSCERLNAPNVPPAWAVRPPSVVRNSSSRPGSADSRGGYRAGSGTPRGAVYTPRCHPVYYNGGSRPNTPGRQRSPSPASGGGGYARTPSQGLPPAGGRGMVRCPSQPGSRGGSPMGGRAPSPFRVAGGAGLRPPAPPARCGAEYADFRSGPPSLSGMAGVPSVR